MWQEVVSASTALRECTRVRVIHSVFVAKQELSLWLDLITVPSAYHEAHSPLFYVLSICTTLNS